MPEEASVELKVLTPRCDVESDNPERLFWMINNLQEYPKCRACSKSLSSFHWEPFLKPELRDPLFKDRKSGYRPFCSRVCAYNFEGLKKAKYTGTVQARFGVDHPMKNPEVILKVKRTNVAKYGVQWPNAWNTQQFAEHVYAKHGVFEVRSIPGVSEKIASTKLEQSLDSFPGLVQKIQEEFLVQCLSDISLGDESRIDNVLLKWKHECGKVYESVIKYKGIKVCPDCFINRSKGEQDIGNFIESLGFEVIKNDRSILKPKEIDIFIPSLKIGIEFDGTYWHSAQFEDRKKCVQKLDQCELQGIRLITIQEGYWARKPEIVKSRLKSILGFNERIFARQCKIKEIHTDKSAKFLNENHLQGAAKAKFHFGLFYKDELVSVCSFNKPRWSSIAEYELIRFATKLELTVVGGASKLMKAFRSKNPGTIISYADRCWSTGNVYKELGFRFLNKTEPSYWWVSEKAGIYSRYQTQKSKLNKLLKSIDKPFMEMLSESDNMKMAGFLQVFDRGNSVWILE